MGNGTNTYLSELLFPSVAKAVVKLKRVPVAIVGADAVRHCGAGERLGEVEQWEGGCVLQVRALFSPANRFSLTLRPHTDWGEVEQWEGGCMLQVRAFKPLPPPA